MGNKKNWKRIIALALSVVMLNPTQAVFAGEGNKIEEMEIYAESRVTDANEFVIDANGVLSGYTNISAEVVIPEGVTSIGDYAFAGCSSLTSIIIPEGVTSIGGYAFSGCSSLMGITIPESVTSIGEDVFYYCSEKLTIYGIMGSYAETYAVEHNIKFSTYGKCGDNLTWVLDSNGTLTISGKGEMDDFGLFAFNSAPWEINRQNIKSVVVEDGVTSIGEYAFEGCNGLSEVVIPEGVTSIGWGAFSECSRLSEITIPNSVVKISGFVFSECGSLAVIKVEEGNTVYDSRKSCNAIIETGSNRLIRGCKNTTIPEGITSIGSYAFYGCSGFGKIMIPEGVTSIGDSAFERCYDLTEVVIPEGVTSIGGSAFRNCSSLSEIVIPESVTSIGKESFYLCSNLSGVVIPEGVTSIGGSAFYGCSSLSKVTIPEGVTSIEDSTFHGCSNLSEIVIPEEVTSIGGSAFYGCSNLSKVAIPESVTSIGGWGFGNCSSLSKIIIPESVTNIDYMVFDNCRSLSEIVILDGAIRIGEKAFRNCISLSEIVIPEGVTSIGDYAFEGCSSLESIVIPDSVTSIGGNIFSYCENLETIKVKGGNSIYDSRKNCNAIIEKERNTIISACKNTIIPEGVTSIGRGAFSGCSGLMSITIPNSVTSIGENAFNGCSNLGEVVIPDSVTSIGKYAFSRCSNLSEVVIPEGVTAIGMDVFQNCSSLSEVVIPEGVTIIGWEAFSSCSSLTRIRIPESVESIEPYAFDGCSKELTIYGKAGSYAETYATANNIKFSSAEMPQPGGKITISDSEVSFGQARYTYDGTAKMPEIIVKVGDTVLTKDMDYVVTYINNINAGTATANLEGIGNYTGTKSVDFTIYKATPTLKFASSSISKTLGESSFTNKLTVDTDGAVAYSSSKPSVATIDESSGIVTLTGIGTATITAIAEEGNNYTSKSASYQLTVEKSPFADLSLLTYSFGNSRFAFGYNTHYKIPLSSYRMVYSDVKAKSLFDNWGDNWGGSCYGMSSTAGIFNVKSSGMAVSEFNASANGVSDLKVTDKNSQLDVVLRTWIEAMHVSQYDASVQRCFAYNEDLDSICTEIDKGLPVIIGVWGPEGGHAIVGYKVEKISADQSYLYVYDCNFPKQIRTVTLTTDRLGKCTGWYYHLNDRYDWGSDYDGCGIAYVPYSCYQAMWANSPAANASPLPSAYKAAAMSGLAGDASDSQNILMVNSDEFKIQDSKGTVVAEVKEGRLTEEKQGIYQFRPTDLMLDIEEKDDTEKILIYLPTDAYMIKNSDDSIDKLEIDMVDENQSIDIETTADDVTVHVDDSENRNVVNIHADKEDSYEIVLNSSLENAKNMEEITFSGTAAKNTIEVGMTEDGCVLKNCTDVRMKINGQELGSAAGSGKTDISKAEATLEYASCAYDGKNKEPEVVIKAGPSVLKKGTDYLVVYSNNIEPGTATATVYGIADYAGKISLDFQIKGMDSNSALKEAKDKAKKELNAYRNPRDYREAQKKELIKAIADGRNAIDSAKDEQGVEKALSAAKAAIDKIKTDAQLTKEERAGASISSYKAALSKTSYTYDGKKKEPDVAVMSGKTKLIKNTDYTVAYKDNVEVGTASVEISGKGKYAGKITKAFEILPQGTSISGRIAAKSRGFTAKWKKQKKSTSGYQIQYSTSRKFTKKTTVTKTVKKNSVTKLNVKCDLLEYLSQRAVISEVFCDGVG